MSHPVTYMIAAASLSSVAIAGMSVTPATAIAIAAVSVAIIGVPHGGLDHRTGRRLLTKRVGPSWPVVFLPTYLLVGLLVAAGWHVAPVPTLVAFFLASAWHFGREDGLNHLEALAVGGLIIWVPALARPAEMEVVLQSLIVNESATAASQVVTITRVIAIALLPIAVGSMAVGAGRTHRLVGIATTVLAIATPILWSFTLFFCGWHSIRGLARMRAEENLSGRQFALAVMPLSIAAVALVIGIGTWFGDSLVDPTSQTRMLFIGLASIAVPHLLLHEIENGFQLKRIPLPSGEVAHVG